MDRYYLVLIILVCSLISYKIIRTALWGKNLIKRSYFKTEAFFYIWVSISIFWMVLLCLDFKIGFHRPSQFENHLFWLVLSWLNIISFSRAKVTKYGIIYKIYFIKWNKIEKIKCDDDFISFLVRRENKDSIEYKFGLKKIANLSEIKRTIGNFCPCID